MPNIEAGNIEDGVSLIAPVRYDLSGSELSEMSGNFLLAIEEGSEYIHSCGRFSAFVIQANSQYADIARSVEGRVFSEEFGNDSAEMSKEYAGYEANSEFITVFDMQAVKPVPIGVLRVINSKGTGRLKSLDDISRTPLKITKEEIVDAYGLDIEGVIDIGTLAVLKDYRRPGRGELPASAVLYHVLYDRFLADNPLYDHVITMIDKTAESYMNRLYFPFEPILGTSHFEYLGSDYTRLMIARNQDFEPSVLAGIKEVEGKSGRYSAFLRQMLAYMATADIVADPRQD